MGKLIIDISELVAWQGRLTGVPRVMNELTTRFVEADDVVFVIWDGSNSGYVVDSEHTKTSNWSLKRKSKRVVKKLFKSEDASTAVQISPQKGDTVFVLADWHGSDETFVKYLIDLKQGGVTLAQMSYDMLPVVTPQYSGHATKSFSNYTKKIYPISDVIIAISEHTKKDIKEWLENNNLPVPNIEVIRLGDDFKRAEPAKPSSAELGGVKDFILSVGTIEARKNHTLLYYTYKLASQRKLELPKLVIVGRRGWKSDDIYEVMTTDPDTKNKFILLESASDEELSWLYQNSLFSVYPSFYEGWGLPIAESISYGAPCICSNTSSMPEVAGDLVTYFTPSSTDECLQAISDMLKPGAIQDAKRKISTYKPTSWDTTFDQTETIIKELHAKND